MTPSSQSRSRDEWRAHWRVVLGSALGVSFSFPTFAFVSSLFVHPLEQDFGWTRGQQALTQNIYLLSALLAPVVGRLVDVHGARKIAMLCLPGVALSYLGLAAMPGQFPIYVLMMACLILIGSGTSGIVYSRAVVSSFDAARGAALAISRLGISVSAAVLPPLVFAAIAVLGWRAGFLVMALLTLLIAWPATWRWVHEAKCAPVADPPAGIGRLLPPVALLKDHKVILLALIAATMLGPIVGLLSQLQPLLIDKGIEAEKAAAIVGTLSLSVLAGTVLTGFLADRIWAPLIGVGMTLAGVTGFLLLSGPLSHGAQTATLAVVLVGLAQGAELDLIGYLIARYLGLEVFSGVFGLGNMMVGLASAIAGLAFGIGHDHFGSYDPMLRACALTLAVAALMFVALGRYPKRAGASAISETLS